MVHVPLHITIKILQQTVENGESVTERNNQVCTKTRKSILSLACMRITRNLEDLNGK